MTGNSAAAMKALRTAVELRLGSLPATCDLQSCVDAVTAESSCSHAAGVRYSARLLPGAGLTRSLDTAAEVGAERVAHAYASRSAAHPAWRRHGSGWGSGGSAPMDDDDEPMLLFRTGVGVLFRYSLSADAATTAAEVPQQWGEKQLLSVFRLLPDGARAPWVVIGPSAGLAKKGQRGTGVYAWGAAGFWHGPARGRVCRGGDWPLCAAQRRPLARLAAAAAGPLGRADGL